MMNANAIVRLCHWMIWIPFIPFEAGISVYGWSNLVTTSTKKRMIAARNLFAENGVNDNDSQQRTAFRSSMNATAFTESRGSVWNDSSFLSHSRRHLLRDSSIAVLSAWITAWSAGANPAIAAVATSIGSQKLAVVSSPPQPQYDSEEMRRIAIFEKTSPSVVFIDTFIERRDSLATNAMEVPLGSGSGFVWDRDGHVVTNYHVVQNAQSAQVTILLSGPDALAAVKKIQAAPEPNATLYGESAISTTLGMRNGNQNYKAGSNMLRRVFTAKIVGVDPGKDIAVLKIDADSSFLFPIAVGTSKGIKVGQQAMAIGNPFGLDHTLTVGVISGTGREVRSPIGRPITDVLQTDAAINPGNSGGPLLDSSGRLIGMNTAIYSPSGASAGIGFAIPVDAVQFIVETLIRDGQVVRPILGISLLGSKQARTLGINSGVLVLEVPPDSPAAQAGMKGTRRTESGFIGKYYYKLDLCLSFHQIRQGLICFCCLNIML
jgi:S1-C subfamily serine protease